MVFACALLTGCGLLQPASPTTTVTDSAARSTTEVPDDWPSLTAALDAELATQGFGPAPRPWTALRVRRRRTPTDRALGARIASRDRMTA